MSAFTGITSFRVAYLRQRWRSLGHDSAGRAVAIYGAGRHTRFLLEQVRGLEPSPRVSVILDDDPRRVAGIEEIPVRRPGEVEPLSVWAVVVSSDSIEERLAARARAWAEGAPEAARPRVIRLYEKLPPGPYRADSDMAVPHAAWAGAQGGGAEEVDPFSRISRLARGSARSAGDPLPLPPMDLRAGYIFGDEAYLASGRAIAAEVRGMLRAHGAAEAGEILEWGCSTGRVLRHWLELAPSARLWGCDIDGEAIGWSWGNLWPPVRVFQCSPAARIALPDASMDLVYGISVFTHIASEPEAWLMELRRITRPGGHVFVSINDEHVWARCGREPEFHIARLCPRLDFSRPMEEDFVAQGLGIHAQSFWRTDAVHRRWSAFLDVLEIRPAMIDEVQTGVLLRRAT